jgi:uncharacterized paraquat-inducible protein A
MSCKGKCGLWQATKPKGKQHNTTVGRYSLGQKRCQICDIFINYNDGVYCPCCSSKLRLRPRSNENRRKMLIDVARF